MTPIPDRYVILGLRLGRHVDGLVDGYFGPAELQAAADGDDLPAVEALRAEARELRTEVERSDLDPQRRRWLSAQLGGLECVAEGAAGAELPWTEVVRRCYGIDVSATPESAFENAHRLLDDVLPGAGDLAGRLQRWNESQQVPADRLLDTFAVLVEELRTRTSELIDLPAGERIEAETVAAQPWAAYNWYLGGLASRIELNTDLPARTHFLAVLAAHEGYPGHHTEHACKEALLVRELGRTEAAVLLIHSPESLVSEGIAELALEQALGERWPERVAELVRPLRVPFDAEIAGVVVEARRRLMNVDVNVAYFTNERGWSHDEAIAYHRRWSLYDPERVEKAVAFSTHPFWSAYIPTYARGYELVRAYAQRDAGNFRRLLTEQLTTADLI